MLNTEDFGKALSEQGYNFYSGVPCSLLKPLINYGITNENYLPAVNEGDAVAHACGATLAGKKSVVLMQNSGLGNTVSPLTSLNYTFKVPVLGFVSLRGEPGIADEPQHELMGTITEKLLETMKVHWQYLDKDISSAKQQIIEANKIIEAGESFFFVVRKGTFESYTLVQPAQEDTQKEPQAIESHLNGTAVKRQSVLQMLSDITDERTILLATTGVTGRELYQVGDRSNQFYMVGSMGCISPLALGMAVSRPDLKFVAIDGDGALLMRMGNLATLGHYQPNNLLHLLLDNGVHESTGSQATVSPSIDFCQIAKACGYQSSAHVNDIEILHSMIQGWLSKPHNQFIRMDIQAGHDKDLIRPTEKPHVLAQRLQQHLLSL